MKRLASTSMGVQRQKETSVKSKKLIAHYLSIFKTKVTLWYSLVIRVHDFLNSTTSCQEKFPHVIGLNLLLISTTIEWPLPKWPWLWPHKRRHKGDTDIYMNSFQSPTANWLSQMLNSLKHTCFTLLMKAFYMTCVTLVDHHFFGKKQMLQTIHLDTTACIWQCFKLSLLACKWRRIYDTHSN